MKIEYIKLEDLQKYSRNARRHPKKQITALINVIEKLGFRIPILVDKENIIIAGHGRYEAARKLGMEELPAIRIENLTDKEIKALRIADNKLSEMGKWDMELLVDEVIQIPEYVELCCLSPEILEVGNTDFVLSNEEKGDQVQINITATLAQIEEITKLLNVIISKAILKDKDIKDKMSAALYKAATI